MRTDGSLRALAVALLTCGAIASSASADTTIYDSGGFEAPRFVPGLLPGQDVINGPWQKASALTSTSTATVQTTVKNGGSQAVQINRGSVDGDARWAVLENITDVSQPISVQWTMNVQQTTVPVGSFGPFFGVEMYDGQSLIGSLGVDAVTGEVLFQETGTGFINVVPGFTVSLNSWHDYKITADFAAEQYSIFVDGVLKLTEGFVDSGINGFTDAPLSTLGTAGDPGSQAATGTAYVDGFSVSQVPEPATLAWVGLAVVGISSRVNRRSARAA